MHADMHAIMNAGIQADMHADMHAGMHADMHADMQTGMQTCNIIYAQISQRNRSMYRNLIINLRFITSFITTIKIYSNLSSSSHTGQSQVINSRNMRSVYIICIAGLGKI